MKGEFTANILLPPFARRLRRLRLDADLSAAEVAEKCNLQHDAISRYEQGKQTPSMPSLLALANFFDVSIDFLLGRTDLRRLPSSDSLREISNVSSALMMKADELRKTLNTRDGDTL